MRFKHWLKHRQELRRVLTVAASAVGCGGYSLYAAARVRPDFDQFYGAARALLAGLDPYAAVGPGRWFDFHFPFYYPLPAAVLAVPFALLPLAAARALFAALCGGTFAMALTHDGTYNRTPALLSGAMLLAMQYGQLAPLLAAALAYPWLAGLVAVKPSTGLAVVMGQRRRADVVMALGVAVALTVLAFLVRPGWVPRWLATVRTSQTLTPMVLRPGGALLLLAWLQWRDPMARWIGTIALVPVTSPLYESLALFLAPWTFREALVLALLTHAARWAELWLNGSAVDAVARIHLAANVAVIVVYLPALAWRPGRWLSYRDARP